jgi:hypothetical protein
MSFPLTGLESSYVKDKTRSERLRNCKRGRISDATTTDMSPDNSRRKMTS